MIKRRLNRSHGAEQPVEESEADAKVLVHESLIVQDSVMNVMEIARPAEPVSEDGRAFHPKTLDVHAVVEIAEDPKAPGQDNPEKKRLVPQRRPEEPEQTSQANE